MTKYRPEIDGLRAVAVAAVILYHTNSSWIPGGFLGVDMFFVISGYLISRIIAPQINAQNYSHSDFLIRRAKRLLPALVAMLTTCWFIGWLFMIPKEFKELGQSIVATLLFSNNILLWLDAGYFSQLADGYFAPRSELNPLIHTWSLGVEEQFYLLFPLALIAITKFFAKHKSTILFTLLIASFGVAEWSNAHSLSAGFYLLPARLFEFGLGASIPTLTRHRHLGSNTATIISLIGLALISISLAFPYIASPIVRSPSLLACAGTTMVITGTISENFVGKILSCKLLVFTGLLSYSLYLWHQPIFAFSKLSPIMVGHTTITLIGFLLLFVISYLSWRFIETPHRKAKIAPFNSSFVMILVTPCILMLAGLYTHHTKGVPSRLDPTTIDLLQLSKASNFHYEECAEPIYSTPPKEIGCEHNSSAKKKIALIGDSHAMSIAEELVNFAVANNHSLLDLSKTGCSVIAGLVYNKNFQCAEHNKEVLESLKLPPSVDTIVIVSRWTYHFEQTTFDNQEGGRELPVKAQVTTPADLEKLSDRQRNEILSELLVHSIQAYIDLGAKIILVYPIPEAGWQPPRLIAQRNILGFPPSPISTSHAVYKARNLNAEEALNRIPSSPNLTRIHPEKIFCNSITKGRCINEISGIPIYFDGNHLNKLGGKLLVEHIFDTDTPLSHQTLPMVQIPRNSGSYANPKNLFSEKLRRETRGANDEDGH